MKTTILFVALAAMIISCNVAYAKGDYVDVDQNDKQFKDCISYSKRNYSGGDEASPIRGQSKAVAYCECMWQETPEDFKGHIAKFGETEKGKKVDKLCAKYSNWQ